MIRIVPDLESCVECYECRPGSNLELASRKPTLGADKTVGQLKSVSEFFYKPDFNITFKTEFVSD